MSHENPASLIPGSIHLNRNGEKVFIECVRLKAPWAIRRRDEPILGIGEGMHTSTSYSLDGKFDGVTAHYRDLICEYKEPTKYFGYIIVNEDGNLVTVRNSLEQAITDIGIWSRSGSRKYKIIKVDGTEEVEIPFFNPLAHEQCK